jgi:hypothetical protein
MRHVIGNAIKEIIVESCLITGNKILLVLRLDVSVVAPVGELKSVSLA